MKTFIPTHLENYLEQKLVVVEQMEGEERMEEIPGKGVQLQAHKDLNYLQNCKFK